jgi:serine/threonine protein kinase
LQANILIDRDGKALLGGFGLSAINKEFEGIPYYSSAVGSVLRWRAPELLVVSGRDVAPNPSTACDIYSYGSIMLQVHTAMNLMLVLNPHTFHQVLSGRVPYHYFSEIEVLQAASNGILPRCPSEPWVKEIHWKFIWRCWDLLPSARPRVEEVNDQITAFHHGLGEVRE